jgi:hypothetical protein
MKYARIYNWDIDNLQIVQEVQDKLQRYILN